MKLLGVFNLAISEGLQLCSQIYDLTISNGTLNAKYSNAFCGLTVRFLLSGYSERESHDLMTQSSPFN
jgi:hypothetical protein